MEDAIGLFLLLSVYEPIVGAIFLTLRRPFEDSLNVIYAGNGAFVWLILWLVFGGVPPILLAIGKLVSHFGE